jgi:exportin-7
MIYENLLSMLFNPNDKPSFLTGGIAKALARVCRLGWLEIDAIKQVTITIEQIIAQNFGLAYSGFKFFEELITEIGEPIKARSLSISRKIAVSFRDEGLGNIFSYCLYIFNNKMQDIPRNLLASVLNVLHMCMNFDFLGISSDETSDDSTCLQIPMTWKSNFENPVFFNLLEFIIINTDGEVETIGIRVFNHTGAVRKSIFSGNIEIKQNYIAKYLKTSENIIKTKKFEGDSLFELNQSIKRFISNFSLKEVSEVQGFDSWIQNLANFSLQLFRRPEAVVSGIESSMFVWNYLAYESHHQLYQKSSQVSSYVSGLFKAFLDSTLSNVSIDSFSDDNELELKDHIEMISNFSLYYYSDIVKILEGNYLEVLASFDVLPNISIQAKLAWLVCLASGFVALREKKNNDVEVRMDSMMIQLVFQTISTAKEPVECLETSCLMFFLGLNKAYINSSYDTLWGYLDTTQTSPADTLNRLLTSILEKCFKNLSISKCDRVTRYSLELFEQLSKGYYSNKILIKNEMIQNFMMQYRTYPICLQNLKFRYRVFNALAHLWTSEDLSQPIEPFLVPMSDHIQMVIDSPTTQGYELLFRELQGICNALSTQKNYLDFFEWLYERLNIIIVACQNYLYENGVMDALLKFLFELVNSRNTRIKFDNATAYGVILFKNLSNVINGYGKVILENAANPEFFKKFYGKIRRLIGIMTYIMNGGYVSFGVFEVYGDTCFIDSLRTCFSVLETIPRNEITVKAT